MFEYNKYNSSTMLKRIILFLILNFAALGIGGFFTGDGVVSEWYMTMNKAPWTPLGWVFGAAWTTIMICFSVYMAHLWTKVGNKNLIIGLYATQWILNTAWNPTFFYFKQVGLGLVVIVLLTLLVSYFLFRFWKTMRWYSVLILPYFVWMLIATSLNAYAFLYN